MLFWGNENHTAESILDSKMIQVICIIALGGPVVESVVVVVEPYLHNILTPVTWRVKRVSIWLLFTFLANPMVETREKAPVF